MAAKTPTALYKEAQALEESGDIRGAIKLYKSFLSKFRTHPNALKMRIRTAQLCVMTAQHEEAVKLIENCGGLGERNLLMMYTLAQANAYLGKLEEAQSALEKVLDVDPDYPPGIARLSTILQYEGRSDEALEVLNKAMDRGVDAWDLDHTLGELAKKAGRVDEAVDRIERRLATDTTLKNTPRIELEFMLASLKESQKDYRGAWEAATRGNSLKTTSGLGGYTLEKGKKLVINMDKHRQRLETVKSIYNPEFLRSLEPTEAGPESRHQSLMISGMPRSGTTLLEQILSAHPDAESAAEATCLYRIAVELKLFPDPVDRMITRSSINKRSKFGQRLLDELRVITKGSEYTVDKNPGNDEMIGLLAAIAPGSKMILTRRDPRDVALSCYFRNFASGHEWTTTFGTIAEMCEMRQELHEYWLDVIPQHAPWIGLTVGDYQKIVENPESETRRIVEFAGLSWDDACLNFSKRKRIIPTLQPHQAAQGVYKGSLAKWAPYAEFMGDALDHLNRICERFDYQV